MTSHCSVDAHSSDSSLSTYTAYKRNGLRLCYGEISKGDSVEVDDNEDDDKFEVRAVNTVEDEENEKGCMVNVTASIGHCDDDERELCIVLY